MPPEQNAPLFQPSVNMNQPIFLRPERGELIVVGQLGLAVGLGVPLLSRLLNDVFVRPVFCNSGNAFGLCANSGDAAYGIASILCAILAIILLANWQVFRPLLIAVATVIALWSLQHQLHAVADMNRWAYYGLSAGIYMVTYLLFYWLLRIHKFIIAFGLVVLLTFGIRLMLLA
ncbi:MAG TPA: hypothetical protein VNG90_05770 [Candidatus Acidoferrum sp.]|nr:hypothetical protein [Candidatus Acidoferrum sp.]